MRSAHGLVEMTAKVNVLVVEDDEGIVSGLKYALSREGFAVDIARDGESALQRLRATSPDLVLLDIMLPGLSGLDVLRTIRQEGRTIPVILVTSAGQEIDKVRGLDLGADDYVTKPFGLAELVARMRARLRRTAARALDVPEQFALGEAQVDLRQLTVRHPDRTEALTVREADMLRVLYSARGSVISRNRFLDEVWGEDHFPTTRTIDQHIANLRRKVEADASKPRFLRTVFGSGYRLDL